VYNRAAAAAPWQQARCSPPVEGSAAIDFPMASDPHGSIFGEFTSKYIPRTYLISRDGTIVFQTTGFDPDEGEITKLKALLHRELASVVSHTD